MEITDKKFVLVQKKAEEQYKEIGSVYCPYLKNNIAFNARGLEHIKFKGRNKARSGNDQYIRLRCLPLAKDIVNLSHTLQGYQERNEMVKIKKGKWSFEMKQVRYYEFVAIIKDVRMRVIIKRVEGGELHFWSIIPFWKMGLLGNKLIHNGKPYED